MRPQRNSSRCVATRLAQIHVAISALEQVLFDVYLKRSHKPLLDNLPPFYCEAIDNFSI